MFSTKLLSKENAKIRIVWVHGWGHTNKNMLHLANKFATQTENYAVDLMGFGNSPQPDKIYTNWDYAKDVIDFINTLPVKKTIIVGHSHGGRIAIEIAASNNANAIVLLGGAGVPVKHSIFFKIFLFFVKKFKFLKNYFPFLIKIFGSTDYNNSTPIVRESLKNVINEDLRKKSEKITIPTLLLYGDYDTATPIYMGEEYKKCIPNAELNIINGANHFDIIGSSAERVHFLITKFIREKL
ncbi:MAG: alpha/beta hydrolase [Rickettsiales bacterium]|jgi:pimeloyl-ACP methyl ester carboxylesterase|nr:alpha/beta hydrolase [Rickettsiales bacterium]